MFHHVGSKSPCYCDCRSFNLICIDSIECGLRRVFSVDVYRGGISCSIKVKVGRSRS